MAVSGESRIGSKTLRAPLMVSLVLFVFAAVAAGGTVLILTAMDKMAFHANTLDTQRAQQTASGALASFEQQMASATSDYSAWDDAAKAVYVDHDREWIEKNYGVFTGAGTLFDTYFLATATGETAMAYKEGSPFSSRFGDYFGSSFATLRAALEADMARGIYQKTGFVETVDGVAVVGIAAVRSSQGSLTVAKEKAIFVIFARHLNEAVINQLAHNYIIDGLRLVPKAPADRPFAAVRNSKGDILGAFVWDLREPGTRSYRQVLPMVGWGLIVIGLVLLGLLAFGIVIVRRLMADERAARQLSKEDLLSGLLNRAGLNDALDEIEAQAAMGRKDAVLIYLDLDRFKDVNDAYGHTVGDQLIRGVTAGLKHLLPKGAAFARIGGDEFAIALVCDDTEACCAAIEQAVIAFFREPLIIAGRLASVGASMGIAVSPQGVLGSAELLRRADMAMYRAKASRAGRAVYYQASMDEDREARMTMANDLRQALDRDALTVVYQPVFDAHTRIICGVEALVRWNRNGHGFVAPDVFIPIAEDNGLIGRIGEFVMRQALLEAANWPRISVAINISPLQLHDVSFVSSTAAIIEETGFPAERVILELTEGFFIRNPDRAKQSMAQLQRNGFRIALDDFGSGFSSVGYLREFGFDRLKIDRSLINALGKTPKAGDLLKATVALASSFDIPVTAEGIETPAQADYVSDCGCDELQGFFFSKPVSAGEISCLLEKAGWTASVA
ncbi:putative bifunctional diguanylate cyclase/phosphodiesterase [Rhizobium sp. C4]|uniref:putative bifunctional diguanylate cyclase/phosphodiesterase n=1 Tax=Rhizobium sp. C4 TaxID=1349800 RepID=UPI001E306625|nr:bifunctional diguanylate cyclase/phosphodiesterase [Rhizobium sp. C4]MCD2175862.1 bifunctional diguanylate cyclase/phosphodiesterase [Rhizobium sp. C4]